MLHRIITVALVCAAAALSAEDDSRLAAIARSRHEKAAQLQPEQENKIEHGLNWARENAIVERITGGVAGFGVKFGGLAPGSGFAAGPQYQRHDLWNSRLSVRAGVQASLRGYQKFDFEASLPKLWGGRYFAQFNTVHHNYPSLSFYGGGPDSHKTGRTDFRLEDTAVDATFGVRPAKRFTIGASAGYLLNNIGPGDDSRFISADKVYSPRQAPGIDVQANFARTGGFAQYDRRDNPGGPRRGGNYFAQFSDYRDQTFGLSDFRRLDLEAQHYVSILNERRVFAVRAKSTMMFRDANRPVPFYMQATLGGSEDLRGYRPFRFRDDNLLVMNAEYRWEVFSGLDMALFADAGKVASKRSDLNLERLQSDVGFGFRFNARNQTFLRLDVGFSHEGFQVWVRFNNLFRKGPVHTSSSMGDL